MDTNDSVLIVSTTAQIDNRPVREYLGIVTGEAMMSIADSTDLGKSPHRRAGATPTSFEQRVSATRDQAIAAMVRQADELEATAIIGVDIDYTIIQHPNDGDLLVITASGSVVTL